MLFFLRRARERLHSTADSSAALRTGYIRIGRFLRACASAAAMTGIATAVLAGAQTGPAEQAAIKVELDQVGSIPGRLAMYQRTATPAGDRLFVEGLDMLTPVIVAAEAIDPSVPLRLALYKDQIKEPVRAGTTDAQGRVLIDFRTYPKINVTVTADQPTQYLLAVWTGPKRTLDAPSPFVTPNERVAGRRVGVWMWGAGGLLLGVALTVAWLFLRGRKKAGGGGAAAGILVALLTFSSHAIAQGQNTKTYMPETNWSLGALGVRNDMGKFNLRVTEAPTSSGPPKKSWADRFNGPVDENRIADLWNAINALRQLAEFKGAHPEDSLYEPELAPAGMPRVALQCASQAACRQCFQQAYDSLTETRKWLENNRIVLANYRNYMQRVEDMGRAVSGLGMTAAAQFYQNKAQWDAQRAGVEKEYDQHYTGLMNDLQRELHEIEKCELQVNNYPDWYNRSGFIYYEFMVARYRR